MKKSSAREKFEELKRAQEELKRMQGLQSADNSARTQERKADISRKFEETREKTSEMKGKITKKFGQFKQNIQSAYDEKKKTLQKSEVAVTTEDVQVPKKAEAKKTELKKAEVKKTEPRKAEAEKTEPKKAEAKKTEPKKVNPEKAEPKKAEAKKTEPKKAEAKKTEPKKVEPEKAEAKKTEAKKAESKNTVQEKKGEVENSAVPDLKPDTVKVTKPELEIEGPELKTKKDGKEEPKKEKSEEAEPKKAEVKKTEPKKEKSGETEPKKAEVKKAEPKKEKSGEAEPKKEIIEKAEPEKEKSEEAEPKKAEVKKAESKKEKSGEAEPETEEDGEAETKTNEKESDKAEEAQSTEAKEPVEEEKNVEEVKKENETTDAAPEPDMVNKKEPESDKKPDEGESNKKTDGVASVTEEASDEGKSRTWHDISSQLKETIVRNKKAVLITAAAILVVLIGIYGSFALYYKDKFFKGTYINQIACEGLTVDQIEEQIRKEVEDYKISVIFRGDVTEVISGSDIDYRYVSSGEVQKIKDEQNPLFWISGLFAKKEYTAEKATSFDENKLRDMLESMDPMKESNQISPKDAQLDYIDGEFVILEEDQGAQLDTEAVIESVKQAISENSSQVNVEELGIYAKPEVTKDDEGLQKECEQLNELVKVNVTYRLPNGEKLLNGEVLKEWLDVDENGNYVKNEEKFEANIETFVAELAEEVDTRGKARPFRTTSGLDVTVKGGYYGWRIDQKKEIETLTENIENHETVEREPEYNSREKYTENNGLGTTYIEVNLTEQHLYYYQDGEIVLESDFVSGTMITSRYTPEGVYFLDWKTTDTYLEGQINPETGEPSYRSHVNYWMPFNGGIGFHDALWRSSFGGSIYKNSGSHGCINMPLEKAKKLYSLIDKETPIVCVYTEEYELYY